MARYVITLLILLSTAVLHQVVMRIQTTAAETSSPGTALRVPSEIMNFHQARPDVPVDDSVRQQLETNTIIMRDYVSSSGMAVQLTIVYAENTRRSLHFPEVCLTGQGWEVSGESVMPVGVLFMGKGLILQKSEAREAVLYWFQTGTYCTGNYFLNSYYWAWNKLLLRNPSSMLVRLSTPVGKQGEEVAFQALNEFASALAPILLETTFKEGKP
jgi:EpsI family protein